MFPIIPNNNAFDARIQQQFSQQEGEVTYNDDQNIQNVQVLKLHKACEVGLQYGMLIQTLQLEKVQLRFENKSLENDITQLKTIHASLLNAIVDSSKAKWNIVAEKVKSIVEMFELFCKTYPQSGFSSKDILPFSLLLKNISQVNHEDLRKYPEYLDYREQKILSQEQTSLIPFKDPLVLTETHPLILELIQEAIKEYETSLAEIAPIREANSALIDKKQVMIEFHGHHIKDFHQEKERRFKEVLEKVTSIYGGIKWELPILPPTSVWFPGAWGGLIPAMYIPMPTAHPIGCKEKLQEIQEAVKAFISTLEGFLKV